MILGNSIFLGGLMASGLRIEVSDPGVKVQSLEVRV